MTIFGFSNQYATAKVELNLLKIKITDLFASFLKKEHVLIEELNKSCYIKVINRRKKSIAFKFNLQ